MHSKPYGNEPAFLAELREEELAVLRETTAANTARLFALPSR